MHFSEQKYCTYREQMEPFPGGNQLAGAAQRRIMDPDVDPAMQQLHSYPPENLIPIHQKEGFALAQLKFLCLQVSLTSKFLL